MSRLISSPFHKPSPFVFPRTLPVTSPETNPDSAGPSGHMPEPTISVAGGIEAFHSESDILYGGTDTMGTRLRRGPSLPYHSSGIREAKERTVQRSLKSFIIVVPPSILLQEHGQLGHTLSLGPRHRLTQGMLMPLFPTMYGQLAAIAREYNFPSTAGLCLYFHYSENGVTSTPRISDDSWQMVWGPFLDGTHQPSRPPICGKIDFDIDLRYARWYHAWVASSHREHIDVPMSVVPSTAPSVAHFRTDSRNTDVDLTPHDGHGEGSAVAPQSTARHIPKKLSLVDRLDSVSIRSFSRPPSRERSGLLPPEQVVPSQVLSPIFQEDEPKTAKQELQNRVNNWRVSASLTATSLVSKQGQMSLEPANIPNSVPLDNVPDYEDGVLNLEDFAWSVSSQGPGEYDEAISIFSLHGTPSVHLTGRLQGSVCMTPSTVTSFGPSDYTLPSPIPSSERAFTPDLGYRLYEDVPLTPTTATSWGPPTEYPPSTYSTRSVFSLGLAHRLTFSRPTTPTTATSWGPASWPSSPVESAESDAVSIHLGDRGSFSCPVTPSTATSWGAPLSYPPSPASPFYVRTPDAGERIFQEGTPRKLPWVHNWPYRDTSEPSQARDEATPWAHGWPYVTEALTHMSPWIYGWPYQGTQEASRSGVLDYAGPWNHGWPYRQKAATTRMVIDNSKLSASKDMHVHFETLSTKDDAFQPGVDLRLGYPYFQLYPTGYPDNVECIYPQAIEGYLTNSQPGYPYNLYQIYPVIPKHVISSHLGPQIGRSHPDPTVYPGNLAEIYPRSAQCFPPRSLGMRQTINVRVVPSYPVFQLYHNVYPWNLEEIYPVLVIQGDDIKSGQSYPFFNLYPAVYPHFDLYPSVLKSLVPLNDLSGADPIAPPSISVDVEVWYPIMVIYRPVYPFLSVYVDLPEDILKLKTPLTIALCEYAYPDIIVYPPLLDVIESDGHLKAPPVDLGLLKYPFFDLYPATYPHFDIYPPIPGQIDSKHVTLDVIVNYPVFDLYPAIYPYMNLYPPASGKMEHEHDIHGLVNINYPVLDLYPVVYPHFSLYPPISGLTVEEYGISMRLHPKYPEFELYPSVYPHFSLWPATQPWMQSRTVTRTRKTHAQLHDLVLLEAPQITELHHEVLRTVAATGKVEKYKAHSELQELFSQPAGVGTASDIPISTVQVLEMRTESQSSQPPWIRSSSVSRRPVKIVPSPTEGLLPRSSHNSFVAEPAASQPHPNRPSQISPTESQSHSFPQVVQSLHRSASSSTSDSHAHASDRSSALPPVNERTTITSLARSSSLSDTSRSRYKTTVSTTSKSPTPLPRKRDSLVLQRVRAINASEDDDISVLSLANKFPMPPRPPLASRPPL